jgi:hypothetical protein
VAPPFYFAGVAELADAQDLKSCGFSENRTGSIPVSGTRNIEKSRVWE